MVLADTLGILLVVLGVLAATNGLWLFNRALFPDLTEGAGLKMLDSPFKTFFLGLPLLFLTILTVAFLSKLGKGPNELLGLVLLASFIYFSSIAVSGFASSLGEKLGFDGRKPWKLVACGGFVLELTFLFPLLGWIVIFPCVTVSGAGATLMTIFRRLRTPESSSPAEPEPSGKDEVESVRL